ncbi:MAG: hypothetical protein CMG62_00030 [Candidatus Marinimicrobia bacterium]|nr:hypothetical protein [Candidatus Neomarinimicrobiota bacterium]
MFISSSLVYNKLWNNYENEFYYPFLGYRKRKFDRFSDLLNISYKKKFISRLSSLNINSQKKVGIVNPGINLKSFVFLLLKNRLKFLFINNTKIFIPEFENQLSIILLELKKIFKKYSIKINFKMLEEVFRNSFKKYKKFNSHNCDIVILGSPVNISARIIAADALSKNIPVLCVDHGNETGTEDNPAWGYDEQSFCTHFLGFGSNGENAIINSTFMKPLHGKVPKYYSSNSSQIMEVYNSSKIINLPNDLINKKLVYVPNKLMGANRLGPFLSISDEDYIKWQDVILNNFPNITYKIHPKEQSNRMLNNINLVIQPLEECLDNFDVFIIDNVLSTAFANIAATNKPIIYFNIGLGNLTKEAEALIRDRVIWIDIDLTDPGDLCVKVENQRNKKCVNNYTKKFCLSNHNQTREETVLKTIQKIMV